MLTWCVVVTGVFCLHTPVPFRFAAFRIVVWLIGFGLMAHWLACGFFFIALVSEGDVTWVEAEWGVHSSSLQHLSIGSKYVTALYWSLTTLTTVGYGDIHPVNDTERMYGIFMFVVGAVVYASIFANVTSLLGKFDEAKNKFTDSVSSVGEFFRVRAALVHSIACSTSITRSSPLLVVWFCRGKWTVSVLALWLVVLVVCCCNPTVQSLAG